MRIRLKRLSTRLLLLTILWVSFISSIIGYTMWLNWELEAGSAAINVISDMRYQTMRAVQFTNPQFSHVMFDSEVRAIDAGFERLGKGDRWQPLMLPDTPSVRDAFARAREVWVNEENPFLTSARLEGGAYDSDGHSQFVMRLTELKQAITEYRDQYLVQLRYIQVTLIILAFGSLGAIMYLLITWVVQPLSCLGYAIQKLSGGDLNYRVANPSSDEIGEIAVGLNVMADRLRDSHENLENKVKEKTASVEEKNRLLAQLYDMISYLSKQHNKEDVLEGFVSRVNEQKGAKSCWVSLLDAKGGTLSLAASQGMDAALFSSILQCPLAKEPILEALIAQGGVIKVEELVAGGSAYGQAIQATGHAYGYIFPLSSSSGPMGCYAVLMDEPAPLDSPMVPLLDSFAVHLSVALEAAAFTDRERQIAVVQERQLLAQGLHDSIAQVLSFLNLQVQILFDAIKYKDDNLRDESLEAIRTGVQDCYEDVRELLLNFRERVHKTSFLSGVKTVVERFEAQSHVKTRVVYRGHGPELTPNQKLQIIFIIQEALSNVRKHAQAQSVFIAIDNDKDLTVNIEDDGVGLNPELVEARKEQHVGLSIMKERARRIGATVQVCPGEEGGTHVMVRLGQDAR